MKNLIIPGLLIVSVAATFAAEGTLVPFDIRFVVTPLPAKDEKKAFINALADWLERKAPPKTTITVIDGLGAKTAATGEVPKLQHDGPQARGRRLVDFYGEIEAMFSAERYRNHPEAGRASLNLPESLAVAARGASAATRVIVFGNVVTDGEGAQLLGFMTGATYTTPPSGVLKKTPAEHPFGAVSRPSLGGAPVWFIYCGGAFPGGDAYRHRVTSFLVRYVQALNGNFVSLSADAPALWREVGMASPPVVERIQSVPAQLLEVAEAPPVQSAIVQEVRRQLDAGAGDAAFAIGIGWLFDGDIDLHWFPVPSRPGSVCYGQREFGPARHLGDKTSGGAGFEIIRFSAVPDAASEFWLNVYSARKSAASRTGIVIFRHGRREIERRFTISPTTTGNGNRNAAGRANDPEHWLHLDWQAALATP